MDVLPKKRIFLVGCPRSGTTLLQSLLAAHPQITSFPESKFFDYLNPRYEPKRRVLGMASKAAKAQLGKFLREMGREDMGERLPRHAIFASQYTRAFLGILDTLCQTRGKSIWIEKSPPHLRNIAYIQTLVKEARFIHILRNGADVVASLYEVTRKYPKSAWGNPWSLDKCIDWWIEDIQISLRHRQESNHTLVRYEDLVEDPKSILMELCQFIGVDFYESMLQGYGDVAKQVSLDREPWKALVSYKIHNANSTKFYELFDDKQRQYVLERLADTNTRLSQLE
jgi:hypothetical protein